MAYLAFRNLVALPLEVFYSAILEGMKIKMVKLHFRIRYAITKNLKLKPSVKY